MSILDFIRRTKEGYKEKQRSLSSDREEQIKLLKAEKKELNEQRAVRLQEKKLKREVREIKTERVRSFGNTVLNNVKKAKRKSGTKTNNSVFMQGGSGTKNNPFGVTSNPFSIGETNKPKKKAKKKKGGQTIVIKL